MDTSLIPRPFSPTNAKRRSEENAREAERRSSARNASSSTIAAGGKLDLAGDINVMDGGVVRVIGQGFEDSTGQPYEITSRLTTYENEGNYGTYQSPSLTFSSGIFGEANGARIWSRSGREVWIDGDYPASSGHVLVSDSFSGTYVSKDPALNGRSRSGGFSASEDGVQVVLTDTQQDTEAGLHVRRYNDPTATLHVGHFTWRDSLFARLRTKLGGKLWLESNSAAGSAAVVMDGAGNIDLQTTGKLTSNGSAIGGAVSSVAGKTGAVTLADIGLDKVDNTRDVDKPISTKTQTALDGKASKDGAASLVAYTAGTDLNGVSPKVRYMAGGSNIQFDSGILFNAARAAYSVLCTLPATHRPTVFKDFGMVTSKGWITAQLRPDGTIITGTAFAANDYIVLGSIAPLPLSFA